MKTAQEMFEELGYSCCYKDNNYIDYCKEGWCEFSIMIQFQLEEKTYRIYSFIETRDEIIVIDIKLNKAIQKQIKELGWNEK